MKIIIRIALLAVLIPIMSYGEEKHNHEGIEIAVGVEALSRDLRDLLSQEMEKQRGQSYTLTELI
jgi:hypothetical protein